MGGLGSTGREGKTVLSALSAQSGDLKTLTSTAASLLAALNGRQSDLASLVRSANTLTQATSDSAPALKQALEALPVSTSGLNTIDIGLLLVSMQVPSTTIMSRQIRSDHGCLVMLT